MKINNLILALIVTVLLLSGGHYAYGQWELLNSKPTTTSLISVCFVNKDTGFVGGEKGLLMQTTDGGKTWARKKLNTKVKINLIQFVNVKVGFILSSYYLGGKTDDEYETQVYKTTNGGEDWTSLLLWSRNKSGGYCSIMKVIDEDTIYLAGSRGIIKSTDKGVTWNSLNLNYNEISGIKDLVFTDSKTAYYCGTSYFYYNGNCYYKYLFGKTNDYGNTWQQTTVGEIDKLHTLNSMCFVDSSRGYAVGNYGALFKKTDRDTNWIKINFDTTTTFTSVCFTDSITGYITSDDGKLRKTTDGGLSWSIINTGIDYPLNKTFFLDSDFGIIVGGTGSILKTTDACKNIEKMNKGFTYKNFYALSFVDSSIGYVCGANGAVYKTNDAGLNWEKQKVDSNAYYTYIYFTDKDNGVLYGKKYKTANILDTNLFYRTNDGGQHWNRLAFDTSNIISVSFVNAKVGYASGKDGTILKTIDGGNSWVKLPKVFNNEVTNLTFKNESFGYAKYKIEHEDWDQTLLVMTTDSARTWKQIEVPVDDEGGYLTTAFFLDSLTGFVVIEDGGLSNPGYYYNDRIYKTTDGGANWKQVFLKGLFIRRKSLNNTYTGELSISSINFINKNKGYAVGYNYDYGDIILETTDCGETWQDISNGTNSTIFDLTFTQQGIGYAVGSEGVIFKFRDSLMTNIQNYKDIKKEVKIYPNPADEIIKLSGLGDASTYVEIYNLTGMKILSQRITNTSINISSLADGMYIVKIFTKDNITAAKLIVKH